MVRLVSGLSRVGNDLENLRKNISLLNLKTRQFFFGHKYMCNHNGAEVKTHFGALHSPCGTDFRPALSDATAEWAEKVDQCASNVDK